MKRFRRMGVFLLAGLLCLTGCGGGKTDSEPESLPSGVQESEAETGKNPDRKMVEFLSAVQADDIPYTMNGGSSANLGVSELVDFLHRIGTEYEVETQMRDDGQRHKFTGGDLWFAVEQKGERQLVYLDYDLYSSYVSLKIMEQTIYFESREMNWWLKYRGQTETETMQDYQDILAAIQQEDFTVKTDPVRTPEFDEAFIKEATQILHKTSEEIGRQYYIWEEEGGEYWSKPDIMKQEKSELTFEGVTGDQQWRVILTAGRQKPRLVKIFISRQSHCEFFIRSQEIYDWVLEKGQRDESKKYNIDEAARQKFKTELEAALEESKQSPLFAELGCVDAELVYFRETAHYQKDGLDLECYYFNIAWVMENPEKAVQNGIEYGEMHSDEWGRLTQASYGSFNVQYKNGKPWRTCFLGPDMGALTEERLEEDLILNQILTALEGSQD